MASSARPSDIPQGLSAFVAAAGEGPPPRGGGDTFHLTSSKMLRVDVGTSVQTKIGSMVAHRGALSFARASARKQGVGRMVKKKLTGEGVTLTTVSGRGCVYLADMGKNIILLKLAAGESLSVSGANVLAFAAEVAWDIKMTKGLGGMASAGLSNVLLTGPGVVAVTCHGDPLALSVGPGADVFVDPDAAVAWSGNLKPALKTEVSMRGMMGRGSEESIQMAFKSDTPGFVVIQPYEEVEVSSGQGSSKGGALGGVFSETLSSLALG